MSGLRVLVLKAAELSQTVMSWVLVTPEMAGLLEALQAWPNVDLDTLRQRPEWEQAREWGWAMESGELTGTGLAHVGELPRGIVSE